MACPPQTKASRNAHGRMGDRRKELRATCYWLWLPGSVSETSCYQLKFPYQLVAGSYRDITGHKSTIILGSEQKTKQLDVIQLHTYSNIYKAMYSYIATSITDQTKSLS